MMLIIDLYIVIPNGLYTMLQLDGLNEKMLHVARNGIAFSEEGPEVVLHELLGHYI